MVTSVCLGVLDTKEGRTLGLRVFGAWLEGMTPAHTHLHKTECPLLIDHCFQPNDQEIQPNSTPSPMLLKWPRSDTQC